MTRVYHGSNVTVESPLTGITKQEVVDKYLHFVEFVQISAYVE